MFENCPTVEILYYVYRTDVLMLLLLDYRKYICMILLYMESVGNEAIAFMSLKSYCQLDSDNVCNKIWDYEHDFVVYVNLKSVIEIKSVIHFFSVDIFPWCNASYTYKYTFSLMI